MKTKNKMIVLVEIAIVLCSVFLIALPAIAAEQNTQKVSATTITTASEDDYVLDIYGNANEDDTIDMRDLTYVKLIFFGKKPVTELADAKYDGKLNPLDFIQIKLIIVGKEKELTIVDEIRPVTIPGNPSRIIASSYPAEVVCALGEGNRIVAVAYAETMPELREKTSIGGLVNPDIEKILELKPDLVILAQWTSKQTTDKLKKFNVPMVCFRCWTLDETKLFTAKMGVVLHKEERSKELLDFIESKVSMVEEKTKDLKPDEKPQVFYEVFTHYKTIAVGTYTTGHAWTWETPWGTYKASAPEEIMIELAGGINCVGEQVIGYPTIDPEWVVEKNPDIFFKTPRTGEVGAVAPSAQAMKEIREEIMERPELKNVKCVKEGKVYVTHSKIVAGPREVIGLCYLAKWFHPELFPELNPRAVHEEMLKTFWGLELEGTWGYPEP